jgi:type 1 glutamine amidotransferase
LIVSLACAACGDQQAIEVDAPAVDVAIDAQIDAPPRPLGQIDGLCTGQPGRPRVLVYTYENLWRHVSNYAARLAIYDMCQSRGFNVTTTNDPLAINATRLAQTDVLVFSITSGPGIDTLGRADLEAWLRDGGGIVGLHSASATEPEWQFYYDNIGARFAGHAPGMQPAQITVTSGHPITDGLEATFAHTDEWYFFQSRPEDVPGMTMLLVLDEATLPVDYPAMYKVGYHPIAWAHEKYGGRVFYTAIGHNPDAFVDPTILEIVGRAIEWVAHAR